ncbi:class I SAM-dependent methyltransferase [Streptomyces sp. NPDC005438]|uniref:class I SAM-dependent methyltransferase n=1 Tax=Streptomyces sp. NPDC005438 TaxID=3156880 RepID=UPI0033A57BCC
MSVVEKPGKSERNLNSEGIDSPEYAKLRRNPEYEAMNHRLIELVPRDVDHLVDVGCGDGAVTELLVNALPGAEVTGVDPTGVLVEAARARLGSRAVFHEGDAASVSALLPPASQELAVLANCVHLVPELPEAFAALRTVIRPGGRLLISSAFYSGAESPGDLSFYADLIATARKAARAEGLTPQRRPAGRPDSLRRTPEDYRAALLEAGFEPVTCQEVPFTLGRTFLAALCATPMFASAALPGVPRDQAARLLTQALDGAGEAVTITRRCAYLTAVRP